MSSVAGAARTERGINRADVAGIAYGDVVDVYITARKAVMRILTV